MYPKRGGAARRGRKASARGRGRKSVVRSRQSVRRAKQGLPKRQQLQSSLGGLTLTRFVAARKPNAVAKHIKNTGAPNTINITYPGRLTTTGGFQAYASWWLNAGNDLRRIWASIQGKFVQINGTTNAEWVDDGLNNIPNATFRYVLETAQSMLYLANTSGTPINVELYDVVAKRDSPQVPLDLSGNVFKGYGQAPKTQADNILSPDLAWYVGMLNQTTNASGFGLANKSGTAVGPEQLGTTPYASKLFKDYFKVVRKTNVSLPIGGQHKHYIDLKPNVVIDNDMMSQNSVYKGLSFFTLVVASGVPVVACPDTDPTHSLRNPLGDTSTSAVSVSVIQQIKYKWTWVEDSRENFYRANYINTMTSNTFQSTQPALTKVYDATVPANQKNAEGYFTCQPSGCPVE